MRAWASAAGGTQEGAVAPLNFHDTDKVEGGLMLRFFGFVFSPANFSADALV